MKILYHHRIASKDGQYVHVEEIVKALRKLGHEVIIVAPSITETKEFGSEGGIVKTLKSIMPTALYEIMEFSYSLYAYRKLNKAIREHKPDVIYERYNLFMPAGIWAKRKFRLPLLLEVNAPLFEERVKYNSIVLKTLAKWTERYTWRGADCVLPVTEVLARKVFSEGVHQKRITVIPNGIDLDKFGEMPNSEEAKAKLGLSERVILGFTGFVREWHGLDKVVDILKNNTREKRHLLIVGDGPARASIERRAAELGVSDQVTITGVVKRDEIATYVATFDVALQPDVVDYASPLKMFEYLALGRAIIAPDKDNIKEIVQHKKNGYLFKSGSNEAFINGIEELCHDTELRQRLSIAARATIFERNFTWGHNAKTISNVFDELLDRYRCGQ
jgi:glycosyltransferase involved in cell wall biosynthesis